MIGQSIDYLVNCPLSVSTSHLKQSLITGRIYTERGVELTMPDKRSVTVDCTAIPITDVKFGDGILIELLQVDRQMKISREEHLIVQQKATATVIRNLAHEIKNPLGGLRGAAQLLQEELEDEYLKEYTQIIIEEADRLQVLVNRLLGPNKIPTFTSVNIHQVLERVRHLISAEWGKKIKVIRDYDPSIPEIWAEPDLLIQAILNIARNAARVVNKNGLVTFRSRVQRQFTIGNRRYRLVMQIDIEDNGPGIQEEIKEKIFFPMVSGIENGAGLGLSIAQNLINQHGGLIEYTSHSGQTIFSVLLPLEE
jgi:two-component system nitrogen regulation sensor histidine kinase GlnL